MTLNISLWAITLRIFKHFCLAFLAMSFFSFVAALVPMLVFWPTFAHVGFAQTLKHIVGHYLLYTFKHET